MYNDSLFNSSLFDYYSLQDSLSNDSLIAESLNKLPLEDKLFITSHIADFFSCNRGVPIQLLHISLLMDQLEANYKGPNKEAIMYLGEKIISFLVEHKIQQLSTLPYERAAQGRQWTYKDLTQLLPNIFQEDIFEYRPAELCPTPGFELTDETIEEMYSNLTANSELTGYKLLRLLILNLNEEFLVAKKPKEFESCPNKIDPFEILQEKEKFTHNIHIQIKTIPTAIIYNINSKYTEKIWYAFTLQRTRCDSDSYIVINATEKKPESEKDALKYLLEYTLKNYNLALVQYICKSTQKYSEELQEVLTNYGMLSQHINTEPNSPIKDFAFYAFKTNILRLFALEKEREREEREERENYKTLLPKIVKTLSMELRCCSTRDGLEKLVDAKQKPPFSIEIIEELKTLQEAKTRFPELFSEILDNIYGKCEQKCPDKTR